MTTKELNRDIKRLVKSIEHADDATVTNVCSKEFKRLYYADQNFTAMNKESIKMMLRINLRYRFIPLHSFGIFINY